MGFCFGCLEDTTTGVTGDSKWMLLFRASRERKNHSGRARIALDGDNSCPFGEGNS